MPPIAFQQTIPILRIFDVAKAKQFYCDFLGFTAEWEHTFDDNSPVYMQVSRGQLAFHLSEHHGDACPGATVFIRMTGIREYHQELLAKNYKYYRPGVETTFYNALCMEVGDPFGNKIRFNEYIEPSEKPAGN
ncbi:MAG: VOC family protein [Planctomycetaceae bacterium]|nr:VOC family protein [Planctomycetaceae bacterium]